LAENVPVTTASIYASDEQLTDEQIGYIFRSDTEEQIPLLQQRIKLMRDAGRVLVEVKNIILSETFITTCDLHLLSSKTYRSLMEHLPIACEKPTNQP